MARLNRHLTRATGASVAALVAAALPTGIVGAAHADTSPSVVFYTPLDTQQVAAGASSRIVLGAQPDVASVVLKSKPHAASTWDTIPVEHTDGSTAFRATWSPTAGSVDLQATGFDKDGNQVGDPVVETVTGSGTATRFTFVRPAEGKPLGVFRRADGHAFVRASGITTRAEDPTADAPAVGVVAPPALSVSPTGTFVNEAGKWTYRKPVDLMGNPGLATNRVVIRVHDSVSSDALETQLYNQTVGSVTAWSSPIPGSSNVAITVKVTDTAQPAQVVVGAPVHLRGYVNGSSTPVSLDAVTDAHDGLATFTVAAAGFYLPYVDLNLNGFQTAGEPAGPQITVGTVTRAAPGRPLFHNNVRTPGGSGTVGDSLRGTRLAAAKHYQWIDQDGQLSFTSRAVQKAGPARVSLPTHLTWVNAHGAPFNPRWMKRGRFETRAWGMIRKRVGLRNADMTFQQNAAYGLSVEWEVKDIRPFGSAAALNAAFASLAASAQRAYGPGWQSRVEIKTLSNLSGGLPYALRVLRYAHAHGFRTMLLARGAATRTQIPASAHAYVDFVRGAQGGLYANP